MRTIQDCFREADKESLVREYIYEHPFELKTDRGEDFAAFKDITLGEAYQRFYNKVFKLVDKICNVETKSKYGDMIFFAHKAEDGNLWGDVKYSLIKIDEALDKDEVTQSYAYEFSPISETAGYYVADTYLTNRNLDGLLMAYLDESSFFGYDQEYLEEERLKLEESEREVEEHKDDPDYFLSMDESLALLEKEFGFDREIRDEREVAARQEYLFAQVNYNSLAFDIELEKVLDYLKKEGYTDE